jgi:hypothetical protein
VAEVRPRRRFEPDGVVTQVDVVEVAFELLTLGGHAVAVEVRGELAFELDG